MISIMVDNKTADLETMKAKIEWINSGYSQEKPMPMYKINRANKYDKTKEKK